MKEPLQLSLTALLIFHSVVKLQVHHLHPTKALIYLFKIPLELEILKPAVLQTNGQHLPHPRLAILTTKTEAVDLISELDRVSWVDVPGPEVPQVDSIVRVEYEEDAGSGGRPDHLDDGLVVHCPGPGYQWSVIVGGVWPDTAVLRPHQHEGFFIGTECQTGTT